MKLLISVLTLSLAAWAGSAVAADAAATCDTQVAAKHLNGAAKTSFLKKCNKDAAAAAPAASAATAADTCAAKAAEKHLAGAAKNSFTKKCIADAGVAAK